MDLPDYRIDIKVTPAGLDWLSPVEAIVAALAPATM